jgi:hypothetical protein
MFPCRKRSVDPLPRGGRFIVARELGLGCECGKVESETGAAVYFGEWCLHHGGREHGFVVVISRVFVEGNDGLDQPAEMNKELYATTVSMPGLGLALSTFHQR